MAKAHGAQVIVTAGSDEKCAVCLVLGADRAINYKAEDFSAAIPENSVNVVLDMVGGDYTPRNLDLLRLDPQPWGRDGAVLRGLSVLDEAAWAEARWIADFTQKEPTQGAPPSVSTEVAFVYDDEALYVGARMAGSDAFALSAPMTRKDDMAGGSDRLIVSLDTYHDGRTAYSFAVTAAGVRIDWYHPSDHESNHDHTFEPIWTARTGREGNGWTAEMRIPFSQLRFSGAPEQVWGVNVHRTIPGLDEEQYWVVVPRDEVGWASRFGELVGIRDIGSTRRMELVPYVASEVTRTSDALIEADDPFTEITDGTVRAGLDFKMGLGPNLTLTATVNPDFGQVEADPAEVNLSAFETIFPERRPFFTEGQQNLQGNGPPYYYSRRIGAAPAEGHQQAADRATA